MDNVKDLLLEALRELAANPTPKATPMKKELGAYATRHFPHARLEIAAIINPARFARLEAAGSEVAAAEVEAKTWVHPAKRNGEPAVKKNPAAEAEEQPVFPNPGAGDTGNLSVMTDEELIESLGGLKAAKELLAATGAQFARNAGVSAIAELYREVFSDIEEPEVE